MHCWFLWKLSKHLWSGSCNGDYRLMLSACFWSARTMKFQLRSSDYECFWRKDWILDGNVREVDWKWCSWSLFRIQCLSSHWSVSTIYLLLLVILLKSPLLPTLWCLPAGIYHNLSPSPCCQWSVGLTHMEVENHKLPSLACSCRQQIGCTLFQDEDQRFLPFFCLICSKCFLWFCWVWSEKWKEDEHIDNLLQVSWQGAAWCWMISRFQLVRSSMHSSH